MKKGMYQVILADDESEFREWVRVMLEGSDCFEVVGQASSGAEVLGLLTHLTPDLILSDIDMPGIDGLDMAREVRDKFPSANVILFSGYTGRDYERMAAEEGALGFIPKTRLSIETLSQVLKGEG